MDPRLVTAIIVVVGVPARPDRLHLADGAGPAAGPGPAASHASGPGCGCCPALLFLIVFLVYPTIGTIIHSFQNTAGDEVRRPRQLRLVLHQPDDARGAHATTSSGSSC